MISVNNIPHQNCMFLTKIESQPSCRYTWLRNDGVQKRIGHLDLSGEGTFSSTRKKNHLFKKTQSLGVPLVLLEHENIKFKWIILTYEGKKYTTSRNFFLKFGHKMKFSKFEKQVFLPLDKFSRSNAERFETLLCHQPNLFAEEVS